MKRILLTALFLMVIVPVAFCAEFWGSKKSNKYHYPTCGWARKINQENLVKFNSPEAAIRAGYVPCKVCKPPAASR